MILRDGLKHENLEHRNSSSNWVSIASSRKILMWEALPDRTDNATHTTHVHSFEGKRGGTKLTPRRLTNGFRK